MILKIQNFCEKKIRRAMCLPLNLAILELSFITAI